MTLLAPILIICGIWIGYELWRGRQYQQATRELRELLAEVRSLRQ